tara:strand:+ start:2850 stop:3404 length:555 start_codon:yes stop_codon:yes gene_type:complete
MSKSDEILKYGFIYKCHSETDDKIYIGSCKNMDCRIQSHNNKSNTSKSNLINGELIFEVLEKHQDIMRYDLKLRERYFMEKVLDAEPPNGSSSYILINKNIPTRTSQEYQKDKYEKNKDFYLEKQQNYYNNNKEKESIRLKKYHSERKGENWFCSDCNKNYSWTTKYSHLKTKKHLSKPLLVLE